MSGTFFSVAALVINLLASAELVTGATGAADACRGCTRVPARAAIGCTTKAVQHCNAVRASASSANSFMMHTEKRQAKQTKSSVFQGSSAQIEEPAFTHFMSDHCSRT
eukprot:1852-Heterococcus_DN1.PRE.3